MNQSPLGKFLGNATGGDPSLRRRTLLGAMGLSALHPAFAQGGYPSRPIRAMMPATGGTIDMVCRAVLEAAGRHLGQPVLLDPKPGANGILATRAVISSPPDGYVLLVMAGSAIAANPAVYKNIGFDTERDLAPVCLLAKTQGLLLVVNPSVPARTPAEFIAYCRAAKTPVNYSSIGVGNASHLAMETFAKKAGIHMTHVPYKSAPSQVQAVFTNEVQAAIIAGPPGLPFLQSGQLRAIATTGYERIPGLPNIPTLRESGIDGVEGGAWLGIFAPGGTPREIVQALNTAIVEAQKLPEVRRAVQNILGYELQSSTPQQLAQMLSTDLRRYAEIVRDIGLVQR